MVEAAMNGQKKFNAMYDKIISTKKVQSNDYVNGNSNGQRLCSF